MKVLWILWYEKNCDQLLLQSAFSYESPLEINHLFQNTMEALWWSKLINELIPPINILQRLIRTAGCLWQTRLLGNNYYVSTLVVATFKKEAAFGKHNSLKLKTFGKEHLWINTTLYVSKLKTFGKENLG